LPEFDSSGSREQLPVHVNRAKFHGRETVHVRLSEPKPYEVGMQISRGVYSEVPAQSVVGAPTGTPGRGIPGVSAAEREPERRGTFAVRSCPYVDRYSAQVRRGTGGRVSQREECYSHCPDVWGTATEFCRGTFLGAGVFCLDGRTRREGDPGVHSAAGGRG